MTVHQRIPFQFVPILLALMLFGNQVRAQSAGSDALHAVAEQILLIEVLVKNYCEIGQEIRFLSAREELKESIERFESNLLRLKQGGDGMAESVANLQNGWNGMSAILNAKPDSKKVPDLLANASELTALATDMFEQLKASTRLPQQRTLDLVHDQALITQQAATSYLLTHWKIDPEGNRARFKDVVGQFDSNLYELTTAPENNQETVKIFKSLTRKWALFKVGHHIDDAELVPDFVVRICDSARGQLDKAAEVFRASAG